MADDVICAASLLFAQVTLPAHLLADANVLDGDGGLHGEGGEELEVVLGEAFCVAEAVNVDGAEEAIPALMKAMGQYASACRGMASVAMSNVGDPAVPTLEEGTSTGNAYQRVWCHAALARQRDDAAPHLRAMRRNSLPSSLR